MAERITANILFRDQVEVLDRRVNATGYKPTFKDLGVGIAADFERLFRFMCDINYDPYTSDWRKGGLSFWAPGIAHRMWRNFLESRGGQNG